MPVVRLAIAPKINETTTVIPSGSIIDGNLSSIAVGHFVGIEGTVAVDLAGRDPGGNHLIDGRPAADVRRLGRLAAKALTPREALPGGESQPGGLVALWAGLTITRMVGS